MAEYMVRREIERRGLDVEISSCGLLLEGRSASDMVIAVLEEHDLDAKGHRSRKFVPAMLADADLVVTMERMHARELAMTTDDAVAKIHTLGGLVAWIGSPDGQGVAGSAAERVAGCAAARHASDLIGNGVDEVEDPHGRSKRMHRRTADRIDELGRGLVDGLFEHRSDGRV
jgi:low molecular weight protein-tyrosine phosphatase